mgnify:CR=1 FL=1
MAYELPDLPYAHNALEPHIDAQTMEIHHGKHHATYIAKLNAALEGHDDLAGKTIEELVSDLDSLPKDIQGGVRNNGGGHWNHSRFWTWMAPGAGGARSGPAAPRGPAPHAASGQPPCHIFFAGRSARKLGMSKESRIFARFLCCTVHPTTIWPPGRPAM